MAIPYIRLEKADDFGVISRGDDVALCDPSAAGPLRRDVTCKVIDDAIVYSQLLSQGQQAELLADIARAPPGFGNIPAGKVPLFYRVILANSLFKSTAGRAPTLEELLFVLEAVEAQLRDRDDDFYTTSLLVKAVTGNPLAPQEQAYVNTVSVALDRVKRGQAPAPPRPPEPPPHGGLPPVTAKPSSGIGLALTLGVGGTLVGGPPGGVVGFLVGLLAGGK